MKIIRSHSTKNFILKNLKGSKILLLFLLSIGVYILMVTVTIPEVIRFSGGLKILDMKPMGYSPDYVISLLEALGEKGRHAYLFHQLPLDMIYPFLFGVSNCLILALLIKKVGKQDSIYFIFCFIPLFAGLFDYLENFGIISILTSYPHNPVLLYRITELFSLLKSILTTLYLTILIFTLTLFGIKKIFRQAGQN